MFWAIVILLFIYGFNVVDYLQTVYLISYFGTAAEVNPIMRCLFENNCAWVVKLVFVPILLIIVGRGVKKEECHMWPFCIVGLTYLFVVIHNFCMMEMAGLI